LVQSIKILQKRSVKDSPTATSNSDVEMQSSEEFDSDIKYSHQTQAASTNPFAASPVSGPNAVQKPPVYPRSSGGASQLPQPSTNVSSQNNSFSNSGPKPGYGMIPVGGSAAASKPGNMYPSVDNAPVKKTPPPVVKPKPSFLQQQQQPPPPAYNRRPTAVAIYDFDAQQPGDLGFRKGDVIEVIEKTDSTDAWWKGRVNGREGVFPGNYVQLQ
jgi:hypothetical protein